MLMVPIRNKLLAILYGLVCHGIFLMAGAVMFITILTGFQFSVGSFEGLSAVAIKLEVWKILLLGLIAQRFEELFTNTMINLMTLIFCEVVSNPYYF